MSTTQFTDGNAVVEASESINTDGSGYILTQKGTQTIRFLAGATTGNVYVNTAGDVATSVKSSTGVTDSFSLNGSTTAPIMTMSVNSHSVADGDVIKDIYQDASGDLDVMANTAAGFAQSDFRMNTDGTESFTLGQDELTFAAGTLNKVAGSPAFATALGVVDSANSVDFDLASVASGYSEDVSWNPTSGKAVLNITNITTGTTFSSSLGYINPGDVLKVTSGASIALYNSTGIQLNSTQVNADGSQIDTNYNADGTVASVYQYDANGNAPGTTPVVGSVVKYYSNAGQEEAFGQVNADGSGYLYAETSGATLRFAAGSTQGAVTVDGFGTTSTTFTAANAIKDTFSASGSLTNRALALNVNGHALTYNDIIEDAVMSATGSVDITAATNGFGLSTFTVGTDGSASYAIGQDTLAFAAGALTEAAGNATIAGTLGITDPNNGAAFRLNSAATGFNEDVSWNPTTGDAVLSLTNIMGGNVFTTALGQINPGDVLKVSGSLIALYDANNNELDSTVVNSDGSQTDTVYGANGAVVSVVTYDSKGKQTSGPGTTSGTSDGKYVDSNGITEATKGTNVAGDGYILTQKGTETIRYVATDTVTGITVNTAGDVAASVKASNGDVDSYDLTGSESQPIMTVNANGHNLSDGDIIKDIYTDANGNLDIKAVSAAGFNESDLIVNTDGTESFAIGSDTLSFASGVLTTVANASYATLQNLADPNSGIAFGLTSAATGFSEDVSWNPATGQALLNLTNTSTGTTFSSSLGQINPGDALKTLSNSQIELVDASGHELSSTQINADGSQVDTTYNADGSVASVTNYNASGTQTNVIGSIVNYDNTNGTLEAFGQTNADGSGYLYMEQGATIRYGAGALKQPINVSVSGDSVDATLIAANGVKDQIFGTGGSTQAIRDLQLWTYQPGSIGAAVDFIEGPIHDVTVDNTGSYTITAATGNFGLSTTVINSADGTGSYTLGGDKITFANFGDQFDSSSAATFLNETNIPFDPNSVGFSTGSGILDFNPTTGQVKLIASNESQQFISIGQINPGDTLEVGAPTNNVAVFNLVDASGHVLETTTSNADLTTEVQTFNADGSVASTLNYDTTGKLIQLVSAMASMAPSTSSGSSSLAAATSDTTTPLLAAAHS